MQRKITTTKAASNKPAKAAATVKPVAAVAAKPAKPDATNDRAERVALIGEARKAVAATYNGASLAVHSSRTPKLADCIARIAQPVQQAANGASDRDHSLLLRIASQAKAGAFDPSSPAIAADLGVISRLASLKYIATDGKACTITASGAERVALLRSKAA
jgi:hypothetical protein